MSTEKPGGGVAEFIDVHELIHDAPSFGADEVARLKTAAHGNQTSDVRQELSRLEAEIESGSASDDLLFRAGVAAWFLARHSKADQYLSRISGNAIATYYHARTLMALGRFDEAAERFAEAAKQGYDRIDCVLLQVGAIRAAGRTEEAEKLLRSISQDAVTRAEYSYQMGCILADQGDTFGSIEYLERAIDMDPHHSRALFALANENSLRGNDDEAIQLYERALSRQPQHLGALLNLGLLYEERDNYAAAAFCFRRVLEANPLHERAALYLRDIEAESEAFYDEEAVREEARLQHLLSRPVTDFELSVRSRNCLIAMNIRTLGDLTRVTETDLLAGKNFGETSLHEIRDLMAAHGLQIGQNLMPRARPAALPEQLVREDPVLSRPVADLNLSVRSRKCMTRLGITTVGDLVHRTPDELLAAKNFGVTSLNEIRSKLAELGVKLRND